VSLRQQTRLQVHLTGLQRASGKTFPWSGEYEVNMNNRRTLETVLGVIENWQPVLPGDYETTPFILLANISPSVQHRVLDQVSKPKFVIADTMDLWLNIALPEVLSLLKRIDCLVLNDSEARQLVSEDNVVNALPKIHKLGPKYVIIKKGEHGSVLSGPKGLFVAPAFPLKKVVDPTGAGDSFVGGLIGWLASLLMKTDGQQGILLNVVVGIVGALLAGWFLSPMVGVSTINQGNFSLPALGVSFVGAAVLLAIVNLFRRGATR
jgi:uncharacterized membrane protein YeaQ/YmgE (transglycosylase-associated protein family)